MQNNIFTTKSGKTIELAKGMGFCFGVKRAIEKIDKMDDKKVYVLGKLIHNPQVIHEIEERGIKMVGGIEKVKEGTLVISAHGAPDKVVLEAENKGLKVVDLTCPFVKKLHEITKKAEKGGRKVIVYGDKDHTEVRGIIGNLKNFKVIKDISELSKEELGCKLIVVSQTTRDVNKFNELAEKIKRNGIKIKDTICLATKDRQLSSIALAKRSDIMIVIGGRISSNTKRLTEICSEVCKTRQVESEKELKKKWFDGKKRIGLTAGASTPYQTIEKVKEAIRGFYEN